MAFALALKLHTSALALGAALTIFNKLSMVIIIN